MSDTTLQTALLPAVVHPLDDVREEKLFRPELGRLRLSRSARFSLFALRGYLACMLLLIAWRVLVGM